jgi:predicted ATPase
LRDQHKDSYELIRDTIRMVAPFFDDLKLRPQKNGEDEVVQLEWAQVGSDYPFHPSQLSDGTLRFICLATALLQPNPPSTIVIDEPELGLHPFALALLASLFKQAAARGAQVIASTQSAPLLNNFEPEDVIVVDRAEGESRFRRLSAEELASWLAEDYTLGELWQKNVYGGGPSHE